MASRRWSRRSCNRRRRARRRRTCPWATSDSPPRRRRKRRGSARGGTGSTATCRARRNGPGGSGRRRGGVAGYHEAGGGLAPALAGLHGVGARGFGRRERVPATPPRHRPLPPYHCVGVRRPSVVAVSSAGDFGGGGAAGPGFAETVAPGAALAALGEATPGGERR